MAKITSVTDRGVKPPRPRGLGSGPPADRPGAGDFLDCTAGGSAAVLLHAGDGAGVSDAQERRAKYV